MDKIAVIIPAYNSDRWLARCLDSVIAAADMDTSIYVVDDGSEDMTVNIAREYAARYASITLLQQNHGGPGAARKMGVDAARDAEWICFVDSDDTIPADSLSGLRKYISDKYDIIVGNVNERIKDESHYMYNVSAREYDSPDYAVDILENRLQGMIYSKLIRRRLFDSIDWDTDPSITNHEDTMLLLNLVCAMRGKARMPTNVMAYNYIRRPESLSTLIHLTSQGVERLWNNVSKLDVPRKSLVIWGMAILNNSFMDRGLEFSSSYGPARDIRRMARGLSLDKNHRKFLLLSYSRRLRLHVMRRRTISKPLTSIEPHIAFIIVVHDDIDGLRRTLRSIYDTGYRNIEIIIVNDASSPDCSIKINGFHVKYHRIRLFKTSQRIGPSAARALAVSKSTASGIMFLNPGDTIVAPGVHRCICLIDEGADIAICGRRAVSGLFKGPVFNPVAKINSKDELADDITRYLLHNFYYEAPLGGLVIRRSTLEADDFPPSDDLTTDHVHELLTRISLQLRPLRFALSDSLGYQRSALRHHNTNPDERWNRDVNLAYQAVQFLVDSDADEYVPVIIDGLRHAFVRSFSRVAANPFQNKKALRRRISRALQNKTLRRLFEIARRPMPSPDPESQTAEYNAFVEALAQEARALARKHMPHYLRFFIFRF